MSDDDLKYGTDKRDFRGSLDRLFIGIGNAFVTFWSGLRRNVRIAIAGAAVLSMSAFEWRNIEAGISSIYHDTPQEVVWAGAFAIVGLILVMARVWNEESRKDDGNPRPWKFGTIASFAVGLFFIFSNVSGEALTAGAKSDRDDKQLVRLEEDLELARIKLRTLPEPVGLDAERSILDARVAEAVGWGMSDLNPDGACMADLEHHRMRALCNEAADLRERILRGQAMISARQDQISTIEALIKQIDGWQDDESSAHWKAMSQMTGGRLGWDFFAGWSILIVSGLLMACAAWLFDYVMEELEDIE